MIVRWRAAEMANPLGLRLMEDTILAARPRPIARRHHPYL
jgi:hypothetical protein